MSEESVYFECSDGFESTRSAEHDELDTEIPISTETVDIQAGAEEEKHILLKFFFNQVTALITLGILGFFLILTNICVPLKQIKSVVVNSDETSFNNCSDRESCLTFADVIEQKHEGLKYNFVIGQRGELYIGAGFQCQVYSYGDCPMYVKLLRARDPGWQYTEAQCSRLAEILYYGMTCDKLSRDLQIEGEKSICESLLVSKKRSYHLYDPDHFVKLLLRDFSWTSCGNFSSTKNLKRERIITLESSTDSSCLPLNRANEVFVEIQESSDYLYDCKNDEPGCIQNFEQRNDGLNYNFIIDSNSNLYIGQGFSCKVDRDFNKMLKIKILTDRQNWMVNFQWQRYLQILLEGIACDQIEEKISVSFNCSFVTNEFELEDLCCDKSEEYCVFKFKLYQDYYSIKKGVDLTYFHLPENLTISSGRIVPYPEKYCFCLRYYEDTQMQKETTTQLIENTN